MAISMVKNYKAWLGALALFLMVGIATITFGFKSDVKANKDAAVSKRTVEWYSITQIVAGPNWSASNLKISTGVTGEPTGDECNIDNEGNPCSARFNNTSGSTLPLNTPLSSLPPGVSFQIYANQP
ncbi:hypothetical protein [Pedobacter sp. MC2016-24]|uniref:hypothetical protein n=1 Tax=Pedobacter sp. MC2016-24 TaxID=2780090 RepID=UPI0018805DA5|nr:hypothetical protein [Pedobacter sp. MC2016-24]MBE9599844.1 hypothetical protein [Pedobacter sp. MC2016-24]